MACRGDPKRRPISYSRPMAFDRQLEVGPLRPPLPLPSSVYLYLFLPPSTAGWNAYNGMLTMGYT